jgi:hypothetical protein
MDMANFSSGWFLPEMGPVVNNSTPARLIQDRPLEREKSGEANWVNASWS